MSAAGKLAALNISVTGTAQQLYAVSAGTVGVVTVSITNKASSTAAVSIALTTTTSVAAADWVLYQYPLPTLESFEKPAIVVGPGQYLYVSSSLADVNFVVYGFEDPS